jgi:hypothetical protein
MNRIYQGRVTAVEIPDGKDEQGNPKWKKLDDWQSALWQHHELFQDAVNYYMLALAAMAAGAKGEDQQAHALRGWVAKVEETWRSASRKSETFEGPQKRLAGILNLSSDECSFEKAAKAVLHSSRATGEQLASALLQLLSDKGDLNQICVSRLPWLATASGKFTATSKAKASSQEKKRQQTVRQFHQLSESEALDKAPSLDLGLFLTQPPIKFAEGADAAQMLRDYHAKASKRFAELNSVVDEFEKFVIDGTDTLKIPSPGRKPSGLYPVAALFKYFSRPQTLAAFLAVTKSLAEAKDKEPVSDAIAESRVGDQPHFDYFTNLALACGESDGERDTRAIWFEFDLAAFIEAIKAPRRYFEDTINRKAAADRFRRQITAMEGRGHAANAGEEDEDPLPGFEGDSRIDLLKTILQDKLKWIAEAEGDANDTGPKEYTIRERTVRGFGEIKRRWRAATAESGAVTEKRLLEILSAEQTAHRDDFGSATLYEQLSKPEFHAIWRDSGNQPWHAEDPLDAWLKLKDLQSDLADKERAIRFTPAHPEFSPRFYIFPKKSEAQPKTTNNRPAKPGLLSRHNPGQLSFTAGIIVQTDRGLIPSVVRIQYAAPRLCRDQLRASGDINLFEAPWLQPMMVALGLDKSPDRVNFANCRITLQPASRADIQLAFPVEVNTKNIKAAVAREDVWEKQFNLFPDGELFYNASLRWPHEKQPSKPPVPWHERLNSFSCVAMDLGQRDAAAFARLLISSGGDSGKRPSRFIGATGGKHWKASLERSGMIRLPGEDAQVWRETSKLDNQNAQNSGKPFDFREELWGERGRMARDWEADETAELMRKLEVPPVDEEFTVLPKDWRTLLSFPQQNDKLLVAMRRYQSRIARLHRWCFLLKGDDNHQKTAFNEIAESEDSRLISVEQRDQAKKRDPRLQANMASQLSDRLKLAPVILIIIANRILPMRGRSWQWEHHHAMTDKNMLYHLTQRGPSLDSKDRPVWLRGQRGLSFERIEQIEELRKRFQSLNQTLRRQVGDKPPIRRDESVPDPCVDLLGKLDNLKKQRVNQTAHTILAEALGLRLAPPPSNKSALRQQRDQHGAYEKILDKCGNWIGPVDFIVIEDLSRYRASQGRAPRENSRLMKWCHRAVRDKLKQLCEVFGLPVLETPAAYSSRFCSRSGVPGFRAVEIAPGFENHAPWSWIKNKKDDHERPTAEAAHVQTLIRQMAEAQKIPSASGKPPAKPRTLLAPLAGGPIFVPVVDSANGVELVPALVQADINAAINLALRAVADPRLWMIHPRLRSQRPCGDKEDKAKKTTNKEEAPNKPAEGKLLTREKRKFGENEMLLAVHRPPDAKPDDTRQPNFFADLAGLHAIADKLATQNPRDFSWLIKDWTSAEITGEIGTPQLLHSKSFWGTVKASQWQRIKGINDARIAEWKAKADPMPD